MRLVFITIIFFLLLHSCKKKETEISPISTITIDINNYNLSFGLEKLSYIQDSVYLNFGTIQTYDCDKYRLNIATQKNGNELTITIGNIYYIGGFCVYGLFPATAKYANQALAIGNYNLVVMKNNSQYKGTIQVTNTAYKIIWENDATCMQIPIKTIAK